MKNYLVIADDFTGANDTGVQIRRRGIPVKVVLSGADICFGKADASSKKAEVMDCESWVIDTETRFLSPAEAYRKIASEAENIPFEKFSCVYKKVDSTLRGNIGEEIKALALRYVPELIVFAPAFPDLGRTTQNRIHLLNGVPIRRSEAAGDLKTPAMNDDVREIMAGAFPDKQVIHVSLDALRGGSFLPDAAVLSFDAVLNRDMQTIAETVLASGKRVLWAGSAGLADALLGADVASPPALAVVASLSPVTRRQLRYAEKRGASLVKVPLYAFLENRAVVEDYLPEASALLSEGKDVILLSSSSYSVNEFRKTEECARRKGYSGKEMADYAQDLLGKIAMLVLENSTVSGLFLSGGDTAIGCIRNLGAVGSEIESEIAAGIPLTRLLGGRFDGLKAVTKAGAFGGEDAIYFSLRKLRES